MPILSDNILFAHLNLFKKEKSFSFPIPLPPSLYYSIRNVKQILQSQQYRPSRVSMHSDKQDPFHRFFPKPVVNNTRRTRDRMVGSGGFSISVLRRKRSKKSKCVRTIQEPGATVKRTVRWPAFRTRHPCFVTSTRTTTTLRGQPVLS